MLNHRAQVKALLFEDSPADAELIRQALVSAKGARIGLEYAKRLRNGLDRLAEGGIDVVLLGLGLPDGQGLDAFLQVQAKAPETPVVVLTSLADEDLAIEVARAGAHDYLVKEQVDGRTLCRSLHYAIERQRMRARLEKNMQELRASTESFRNVIESNADGIAVIDRKGIVRFVNPALESLFGRHAEELLCESFGLPIVAGERTEVNVASMGGGERVAEMRVVETVWEGETVYLASLRDVTDRKRAEEELRLRAQLLDAATDSILLHDADGHIAYINEAAYKSRGYTKNELLATNLFDLFDPEEAKRLRPRLKEVAKKGRTSFESAHVLKDGTIMPVEVRARSIELEGKKLILSATRDITEHKRAEERLRLSLEKLQSSLEGAVQAMSLAVEMRDPYTAGHERRVAQLACAIAEEMDLEAEHIKGIRIAGLLHDIGKLSVPAEILSKPGRVNDAEFNMLKAHVGVGHDILKTIEFPWPVAPAVLQHHERMNGSGYPAGLSAEQILIEAKILAVADVVEAMASHRPYRPSLGIDKALQEVSENRGVLYDTDVVESCLTLFKGKRFSFDHMAAPGLGA